MDLLMHHEITAVAPDRGISNNNCRGRGVKNVRKSMRSVRCRTISFILHFTYFHSLISKRKMNFGIIMNRWSKSCFTLLIILFSFTIFVTNLQIKGKASHLKKATGAKGVKLKSSIHEILKSSARQYPAAFPGSSLLGVCPLCDSSVFGYCSHKLIHDTCCCTFPGTFTPLVNRKLCVIASCLLTQLDLSKTFRGNILPVKLYDENFYLTKT
uniref:Uncharacterized protein n=1 Tax=Glossina palpalis gambiensis TaxID=67801 RepID=A0A1B0ASZ8_9MUSC